MSAAPKFKSTVSSVLPHYRALVGPTVELLYPDGPREGRSMVSIFIPVADNKKARIDIPRDVLEEVFDVIMSHRARTG